MSDRDPLLERFRSAAALVGTEVCQTSRESLVEILEPLAEAGGTGLDHDLLTSYPEVAPLARRSEAWPAVAMSLATLAVADTGSLALAEQDPQDRARRVLCRRHVVVVPVERVVPSLQDAAGPIRRWAREGRVYVTLVTGPSRTADIEKILTVGAHGAIEVIAVVLDDGAGGGDGTVS